MIESKANEKVKLLRSLHEAKGRSRSGLFLVEGIKLVAEAILSGAEVVLVLYSGDMLSRSQPGRALLRLLYRRRLPAFEATEKVIVGLSDTETPQGVVAAVKQLHWSRVLDRPAVLGVIADGLQDPGNLGTILRSTLAAGGSGLWITPNSVDVYNPKVVRAAAGAHFHLPFFSGTDPGGLQRRFEPGAQVLVSEVRGGVPYDEIDWLLPSYVIVGNEARGVSKAARAVATGTVTIPMWRGVESLNVAVAASVILFEASRQRRKAWGSPWPEEERAKEQQPVEDSRSTGEGIEG